MCLHSVRPFSVADYSSFIPPPSTFYNQLQVSVALGTANRLTAAAVCVKALVLALECQPKTDEGIQGSCVELSLDRPLEPRGNDRPCCQLWAGHGPDGMAPPCSLLRENVVIDESDDSCSPHGAQGKLELAPSCESALAWTGPHTQCGAGESEIIDPTLICGTHVQTPDPWLSAVDLIQN